MVAEQQAPGTASFTLTATQSFGEGMCQLTMVPNMSSPTSVVNLLTKLLTVHAFIDLRPFRLIPFRLTKSANVPFRLFSLFFGQ